MKWFTLYFFIWMFGYISIAVVCQFQKEYGPYKTKLLSIEQCKGPKKGECTILKLYSSLDMSSVRFTSDIQKECPIKNAKVIVKKANHSNAMLNYHSNQPCQHFVLGPILKKTYNLSDNNNCFIHKGHYEININVQELVTNFFGPTFFYDTFSVKMVAHNEDNNLYCIQSVLKISKH